MTFKFFRLKVFARTNTRTVYQYVYGGRVSFYKEHTVMSVFDELNGAGIVTAAKKVGRLYKIDADYCDVCKKMIFDTDVTGTSPEEGPKYYQY